MTRCCRGLAARYLETLAQRDCTLFLDHLAGTAERESICRNIIGDDGSGGNIRAIPHRDRGDERSVDADEGALPDRGAVLAEAVVIAGDGAGTDIRPGPNRRIADIGEVVRLGASPHLGVLHLNEIADMGAFADSRSRPESRIGADDGAG